MQQDSGPGVRMQYQTRPRLIFIGSLACSICIESGGIIQRSDEVAAVTRCRQTSLQQTPNFEVMVQPKFATHAPRQPAASVRQLGGLPQFPSSSPLSPPKSVSGIEHSEAMLMCEGALHTAARALSHLGASHLCLPSQL
eukprot:2817315-Rhodomonas_salina.1